MSRKNFAYLIALLIDLSNGALYLGLAFHLKEMGAKPFEIGLVGSSCPFFYALSCLLLERFFSRRSQVLSMRLGLVLFLICVPFVFFLPNIWWAIPFTFIMHLGNALFYPSLQIWMTEGFGRKALQKAMGSYCVAWTTGFIVGPWLGGLVGQLLVNQKLAPEYMGPYWVSLFIVVIVFLLMWLPYKHKIPDEEKIHSTTNFSKFKKSDFNEFMKLGWMTNVLGNFCAGIIRFLIPLLIVFAPDGNLVPIDLEQSSYLVPFLAFALLLTVIFMRHSHRWILNFRYMIFVQLLVIPSCLIFLVSHNYFIYFIPVFIFGLVNAFGFYTGAVYSLHLGEQGLKYITINEFLVGLGAFLGSLAGGFIAYYLGSEWAFASPILMMLLMIALQIRMRRKLL